MKKIVLAALLSTGLALAGYSGTAEASALYHHSSHKTAHAKHSGTTHHKRSITCAALEPAQPD